MAEDRDLTLIRYMREALTRDGPRGAMGAALLRNMWESSDLDVRASVLARLAWQARHSRDANLASPTNQAERLAKGLCRTARKYDQAEDVVVAPAHLDADRVTQMWAGLLLIAAARKRMQTATSTSSRRESAP